MAGSLAALGDHPTLSIFLINQSMTKSNYNYSDGNTLGLQLFTHTHLAILAIC